MSRICVFFFLVLAVTSAFASSPKKSSIKHHMSISFCSTCVNFFDDTLGDLLNIILELGVGAGCAEVCGKLGDYTEEVICNLICDAVGFYEFSKILSNDDLDPIWLCQEFDMCPLNTCNSTTSCVEITNATVSPASAPVRTTFLITVQLTALNNTGTGVTRAIVHIPGGGQNNYPLILETLNTGYTQGQSYTAQIGVQTDQDDWDYPAGVYHVDVFACGSDCDDQHGVVFAQARTKFTITSSAISIDE